LLPKLAMKFMRIPAMFGGAIIGGLAYVQYQAARKNPFYSHPCGTDGHLLKWLALNRGWKFRGGHF
jgi:hypothetical protein